MKNHIIHYVNVTKTGGLIILFIKWGGGGGGWGSYETNENQKEQRTKVAQASFKNTLPYPHVHTTLDLVLSH